MNAKKLIELQQLIVETAANGIDVQWHNAVVNIEIDEVDGEQTENCLALSFLRKPGGWKRSGFDLPNECFDLFVALRDSNNGEKWTTCTLEFNSDGNYRFNYSFETPRRLNGIHDDKAMLKDYLPASFE